MPIHPTAIIDPRAEIDPSADIGPFVVIDGPAVIGAGTRILTHAVITGHTIIGRDNAIHMSAIIGNEPQDVSFGGQETALRIGDRNIIREQCEIHRGSKTAETVVGDDNYIMSHAHIGHDCRVGNHVTLAPGALLGGHVEVEDQVFISGNCVVHQFVRIGRLALLRGLSRTSRDVPPFCIMDGTHTVRALNRIGLRRAGFSAQQIREIQRVFTVLFRSRKNLSAAMAELDSQPCSEEARQMIEFIRASKRGVCAGSRKGPEATDGE